MNLSSVIGLCSWFDKYTACVVVIHGDVQTPVCGGVAGRCKVVKVQLFNLA